MSLLLLQADAQQLPLADESVQCLVTSPPYWGLRDYGNGAESLGLEATPDLYVERLVEIFRELWRVLRDDGTCWLNLGDCYAASRSGPAGVRSTLNGSRHAPRENRKAKELAGRPSRRWTFEPWGVEAKDLLMIPSRVAIALQLDGWIVRSEVVWSKPNAMPESVTDRPTSAHEKVFLLVKRGRYFYDAAAIAEPVTGSAHDRGKGVHAKSAPAGSGIKANDSFSAAVRRTSGNLARKVKQGRPPGVSRQSASVPWEGTTRNKRTVWEIPTAPYPGAHFATFPPALVEPCILAGSARGDIVLDPFAGTGTVGLVALEHQRRAVLVDVNRPYLQELAATRLMRVTRVPVVDRKPEGTLL